MILKNFKRKLFFIRTIIFVKIIICYLNNGLYAADVDKVSNNKLSDKKELKLTYVNKIKNDSNNSTSDNNQLLLDYDIQFGRLINGKFVQNNKIMIISCIPNQRYLQIFAKSNYSRIARVKVEKKGYLRKSVSFYVNVIGADEKGLILPDAKYVKITFYKIGEEGKYLIFQSKTKDKGKDILFVGDPHYQNSDYPDSYIIYNKLNGGLIVEIPRSQF